VIVVTESQASITTSEGSGKSPVNAQTPGNSSRARSILPLEGRRGVRSLNSTRLNHSIRSNRTQNENLSVHSNTPRTTSASYHRMGTATTQSDFVDFPDRNMSPEFRGKWRTSLWGCMGNPSLCLWTCVCPCYTAARSAREVGDHFLSVGLLYFLFWPYGVYVAAETRRRIRERKIIDVEKPVRFVYILQLTSLSYGFKASM
jgi:Cys-rich protein (TIGR01571 family)